MAAPKSKKLKEILQTALKELHRRSIVPTEEQWYTRADIARHLGIDSVNLNPARVGALEGLVAEGEIMKRQKPDTGRDLPQYRLS